jgi:hypothetical protein
MGHLVEHGGILLINTAAGVVGRDVSNLLGATLLSLFSTTLARQFGLPEPARRQFLVLVDEFRNYPVDYGYLLSELRKAGLALLLAAQSLAQLDAFDPVLRPTVLANADHLFTFTLAGEDASLLKKELGHIQPEDVVALPDYTCYAKWSLHGKRLPIFSLQLALPPKGEASRETLIRARSAQRDGRPVAEIDAWMHQVHQLHHPQPSGRGRNSGGSHKKGRTSPAPDEEPPAPSGTRAPEAAPRPKRVRTRTKPEAMATGTDATAHPGSSHALFQDQQVEAEHKGSASPLMQ